MSKKIIAIVLSLAMFFSVFAIPASAAKDVTEPAMQKIYTVLDKIIHSLVGGIAAMIKTPNWGTVKDYKTENFFEGDKKQDYKTTPAEGAKWSIGYANASILTGKELDGGDYYVGGSLSVTKKLATSQWDDQKVRTIAISDGDGINIFAAIDCYGLANTDVRAMREKFMTYANEKGLSIKSINISALHQHSCVDTFGLNGNILEALFLSSVRTIFGKELPSGQNKDYMDNLYNVTVQSMKDAVANMKTGTLYFGTVDITEYIRDKRNPQVFDNNLNRFRFVPDEGKETWIVNGSVHCVGNGASKTDLTGDYPYYMEQYINENYDANFFYILGAELAITSKSDTLVLDENTLAKEGNKYRIRVYGETLAQKLASITEETVVAPILNISFKEVWVDVENNILTFAAKGGLLVSNIKKKGFAKYAIVTEVGYCEFGTDIAVVIAPGELAPEIAFGGATTAAESWQGEDWEYDSFQERVGDKKLIVFGLTNDQIGYILNSNNWHSFLIENEEISSTGKMASHSITQGVLDLIP